MKQSLTLKTCQQTVADFMRQKGFDQRGMLLQTVMMAEEMGEVAKAMRHIELKGDTPENRQELAHELVDVLNYICWLATKYEIDLDAASQQKMTINSTRTWDAKAAQ